MGSEVSPYARAALGSVLVGIGGALILQAGREVRGVPCVGCGEDGVEDIARASAEMTDDEVVEESTGDGD